MITLADIERIVLTDEQMTLCQGHSLKCSLGGVSRIRGTESRRAFLNEDQITGQVCTCAMAIWIYGQTGAQIYDSIRDKQNEQPNVGDGGVDIPPVNLPTDKSGGFLYRLNSLALVSSYRGWFPARYQVLHD